MFFNLIVSYEFPLGIQSQGFLIIFYVVSGSGSGSPGGTTPSILVPSCPHPHPHPGLPSTQTNVVLGLCTCIYKGKRLVFCISHVYSLFTNYMYCFKYISSTIIPLFIQHGLFAILSSPAPTDLFLYHRVDYPTSSYSVRARGNSRDMLICSMLKV